MVKCHYFRYYFLRMQDNSDRNVTKTNLRIIDWKGNMLSKCRNGL